MNNIQQSAKGMWAAAKKRAKIGGLKEGQRRTRRTDACMLQRNGTKAIQIKRSETTKEPLHLKESLRDQQEQVLHGARAVFGINLDRINNQIELIGGVDFAGNAPNMVRRNRLRFREVMEAIEAFGMTVLHEENHTGLAVVTRKQ
jgi:hypothetical protein